MIPLRLVLDTNIVVSAALKPEGLQRTVLLLAMTKPARLYISVPVFKEYCAVLARPEFRIRKGLQQRFLRLIEKNTRFVEPVRRPQVTTDPDDNIFVECADAARVDFLVTRNIRHFPQYWKRTKIIASREFLSVVAPHLRG
jgi:uncharacterized protein